MRILVAPDKFKNSLTANEVAGIIVDVLKTMIDKGEFISFPMADGGEGTVDVLMQHLHGTYHSVPVNDPLFRKIEARYGMDPSGKKAFIEMSSASGLTLLKEKERNCLYTTSYGTGELMIDAFKRGCKEIYIGLGGSATNDGGTGMASALGYRFYDKVGNIINPIGKNLIRIHHYDDFEIHDLIVESRIKVLCDVTAPLYGPEGAAFVYAPQKGASFAEVRILDQGLRKLAKVVEKKTGKDYSVFPGAGAAGGLGFGLLAFCHALLLSGFDMVARLTGFREQLQRCDLVITGEGRYDEQTLQGKTVEGIRNMALKAGKPVIIIAGTATPSLINNPPKGINKIITLFENNPTEKEIQLNTRKLLRNAIENLVKHLCLHFD